MAGGKVDKKLGPDEITEMQLQTVLTLQPCCARSHNFYPVRMGDFCYLGPTVLVMSVTSLCSSRHTSVLLLVYSASLLIAIGRHPFCCILTFKNSPLLKAICDVKLIFEILFSFLRTSLPSNSDF